jgi:hypothetical protein
VLFTWEIQVPNTLPNRVRTRGVVRKFSKSKEGMDPVGRFNNPSNSPLTQGARPERMYVPDCLGVSRKTIKYVLLSQSYQINQMNEKSNQIPNSYTRVRASSTPYQNEENQKKELATEWPPEDLLHARSHQAKDELPQDREEKERYG